MNTITKLLVVINLALACVFAGVAATYYATSENWKRRWHSDTSRMATDLQLSQTQLSEQSLSRQNAETALVTRNADYQTLKAQQESLQSDMNSLEKELAAKDLRIANLSDDVQTMQSTLASKEESLAKVTQRNMELNHIAQVSRGVAFQLNVKLAELEDDLNNANLKLTKSEEAIADLQQDQQRQGAMLQLVEDRYPRVWSEINTEQSTVGAAVQGMVAAVRANPQGEQDLIMLTIGADDEVQEGMEFIVYRGDQYIVKVRARKVMPDMTAAWVLPETWN
ncbi:MAG: hypothetical protein ACOCXA_03505, partial [Planctomycetota bacterium]